jgi:hypothetical protein
LTRLEGPQTLFHEIAGVTKLHARIVGVTKAALQRGTTHNSQREHGKMGTLASRAYLPTGPFIKYIGELVKSRQYRC